MNDLEYEVNRLADFKNSEKEYAEKLHCGRCKKLGIIPGDKDGRCQGCKNDGWVIGRRGWRVLGEYDS